MILDELIKIKFTGKDVLILGRPSAGKTWLSGVLEGMYKHHTVLHTDTYLGCADNDARRIEGLIEDAGNNKPSIVEGLLGYLLLLEGARRKCYEPDYVIDIYISAGKQREIYLKERSPENIKYLKKFEFQHLEILNEYHRIVPAEQKPTWLTLNNEW